jgi:flagellin-like protein
MNRSGEEGINEVLATILLVVLVVALAAVILSIVFGWVVLQPKSAYIPPRVEVLDVGGEEVISLTSKGGDPAVLTPGNIGLYSLSMYLDTPGGSEKVTPVAGVDTRNPGQTLYIYNDGTALWADYEFPEGELSPLPPGPVTLRIIDENAQLLVYREGLALGGGTMGPEPPCTLGTGWEIRNKQDYTFEYELRVKSSGDIISKGTIQPKKVIHLWYNKQSPYRAVLDWESGSFSGSDEKENTNDMCEFSRYETDFPGGGGGGPRNLQLLAMED